MRRTIPYALTLFAVGFIVNHCAACKPQQLGATASESAYTAELLRCVDDARTLAESRACRQRVNAHWGITEVEAGAR